MIRNYLKMALRNLNKRRSTSAINIFGLSIGFGCAIIIYLFISHHLNFDNFHNNSDRIYRFVTHEQTDVVEFEASVPPAFADNFKDNYSYADQVAKLVDWEESLITIQQNNDSKKLKENVLFADPEFFSIFNFPLLNDKKVVSELDAPYSAIITETIAKRLFGNDNPIDKTFVLENNKEITVTGILKDFPKNSLFNSGVYVSMSTLKDFNSFLASQSWQGISSSLQVFGLLHPNQNISSIESKLKELVPLHRPTSKNVHLYKLQELKDIHLDGRFSGGINPKTLWILGIIGFFLILIACINFINIATAQSVNRSREIGVRKVMGGQRNQLFWQFMLETFVLTVVALCIGLLFCYLFMGVFNSTFDLNLAMVDLLNLEFVAYTLVLLLIVTLLAGSYPGMLLTRITPILALKGKLTHSDTGGSKTRSLLVVGQFVISIVLIIATLVVNDQITYAVESDLGFDTSTIVMVDIPEEIEPTALKSLKNSIASNTGVENVSACFASPGAGYNMWGTSVRYDNRPSTEEFSIQVKFADLNYVETFDLELVAGRNFVERDTVNELLVNETFARKLGISDVNQLLGKTIEVSGNYVRAEIVGVVADFHDQDFQEAINPVCIAPVYDNFGELAIKINSSNVANTLGFIETKWSDKFPNYIYEYDFLDERVAELYADEQRFLSLTKLFSILAIMIGCLGIYGLITFFVTQRTKEIGIRKVLGGSITHILILFSKDFLKLVGIAGLIAAPLGYYFMDKWLQNYTYRIDINWTVFVLAIGTVLFLTILIIGYKGMRAAKVNPVDSLRTE